MDNKKDNRYYINKIITDLVFITYHTENLTIEELEANEILVAPMMIQISENSDRLTEDFKENHRVIPWRAVKGLRNRIVHEYGSVDMSVVYDTVKNDIPELLKEFRNIME